MLRNVKDLRGYAIPATRDDHTQLNELDHPGQVEADRGGRLRETRSRPLPTPYLSHRLCVTRRLDLLVSTRVRAMRMPDMPPLC